MFDGNFVTGNRLNSGSTFVSFLNLSIGSSFANFLTKDYALEKEDIENLSGFLRKKIEKDFQKSFEALVKYCYVDGELQEIKDTLETTAI